jgi:hypothetical protein
MDAEAEAVILALLKAAKGGDTTAIRMVLERTAPLPVATRNDERPDAQSRPISGAHRGGGGCQSSAFIGC